MKLTNETQVSESVRKLNPDLFAVGALDPNKPKQDQRRALEQAAPSAKTRRIPMGKGARPIIRVLLIRCGGKECDSDNLVSGYKALRDAIAESLGIDDGDPRIDFEYSQVRSRGGLGTIVKMETL